MNNNRLGCLSPTAIISAFITVAVILVIELYSGNSMFSAGSLNAQSGRQLGGVTAHAEIGNDCRRCHPAFWSRDHLADRCAACHTSIKEELADARALHSILRSDQATLNCRTCHPEHRGPAASLTELDLKNFPHQKLGFALNTHLKKTDGSTLNCKDCHTAKRYDEFNVATCKTCHVQLDNLFTVSHALGFGDDCLACHDGVETYGKNFDHTQTAFALSGKHLDLSCTQCHLNARNLFDLETTPQACAECHLKDDAHQARFGTNCGVCHSPEGWRPAKFDHNLADFKLIGKHNQAQCEACHKNDIYKGTPSDCFSCHRDEDEHDRRFGTDCSICHTPTRWEDVNINHDRFAFKLTGRHISVACEKCHINGVFKGTPAQCGACHQKDDKHNGRFGLDCGLCHSTTAWKPATFDHRLSKFPLTGAHISVACEKCHLNGIFQGTPQFCEGCHGEPIFHSGLFSGQSCHECHSTSSWSPAQYNGSHPNITDEHGSGVNHGGEGCRSCHTVNLSTATCTKCHDSNNPGGGGGGEGGGGD